MWGLFIAGGVIYTLQNIQENTQRYLDMKTRTEVVAERNTNKAFPITTICLNSMHSKGMKVAQPLKLSQNDSPFAGKCCPSFCWAYIYLLRRIVRQWSVFSTFCIVLWKTNRSSHYWTLSKSIYSPVPRLKTKTWQDYSTVMTCSMSGKVFEVFMYLKSTL